MLRKLGLSALAITASISYALAGGAFNGLPIVGVPANTNCLSYGNGGVCNQYSPAGATTITGNEVFPADTQLPNGQNPQTELIPLSFVIAHGQGSNRNALIGGDFNTNLWQRGTTPISATTAATATYSADRWFAYSSGNTLTISKQTAAGDQLTSVGMLAAMRVLRPSGTDVTPICVGQVLPAKDAARFLGNNAIFSFYAKNGSAMSSVNAAVDVSIAYVTAADSATPNTITDSFAKSTTTGYTAVVTSANSGLSGTIASAVANIPMSTTMTRYWVAGTIPTTATSVGVKICYTPVGTGTANDYFEFGNAQLETGSATTSVYPGSVTPGGFSRRMVAQETELQLSYSYGLIEATGQFYNNTVLCASSGNAQIGVSFPSQMRMAPTVAVTAGGWSVQTAAAVTAIGTTTLVSATAQQASLTSGAACTATLPYVLKGTNTTGLLMFSAEP